MEEQRDKVSYSEGCKISMEGIPGGKRFESRDIHMSYSTDVRENEDLTGAMDRARHLVTNLLACEEMDIRAGKRGVPPPTPENSGNTDEIGAELEVELTVLKDHDPEIARKAREYLGDKPTKEMLLKALASAKAYNEKAK